MSLAEWNESYSVNIDFIDNQHKKLFKYINDTIEASRQNDTAGIAEVIKGLYGYTVEHFSEEEKFFKESGYKKTEEHLARHKLFTDRIRYFEENINNDFTGISKEMAGYLSGWIISHILTYDKEYSQNWISFYKNEPNRL